MNPPIVHVRKQRKDILLILATAVFLAAAINLASFYLSTVFSDRPIGLLVSSGACLLAAVVLLGQIAFGATQHIVRLRGALAYSVNSDKLEPIAMVGYSFNDDICKFLRAFVHENKAYLTLLADGDREFVPMTRFDPDNLNHHTIVNSVVEFTVLRMLDLHLNSYFADNDIDKSGIVTLSRDQLGAEVLKNRVIDQLTKDMKERPSFSGSSEPDIEGVVVYATGRDGALYTRLGIELPPKSKITRNSDGHLVIANPVFDLTIIPAYNGTATYLPDVFTPSQSPLFSPRSIPLTMRIRVKSTALLAGRSMEMYEWLDSLIERMHEYISVDRLTQRLDPDLVKMLAQTSKSSRSDGRSLPSTKDTGSGVPVTGR